MRFITRLCFLVALISSIPAFADSPSWWQKLEPRDLTGNRVQLGHRWTVLVFISAECPVARSGVPVINALTKEFGARDFDFIAVYADPTDELPALRRHVTEYRLSPAAVDDRAQK